MLLLAAAAYPGGVAAATVDHRLRAESAGEAAQVASLCAALGVPHETLSLDWPAPPRANLQAVARERRYRALSGWGARAECAWLAVAHHLDDQAETLLMRLARGSGVGGAAGARPMRPLGDGEAGAVQLVRPLLGWRRDELAAMVGEAGVSAVDDPANRDPRHDRSRVRQALADLPWLAPERLAAAAAHFADAEEALAWIADGLWSERAESRADGTVRLDVDRLPGELQRRLTARAIATVGDAVEPPGPKLARLLETLRAGGIATLSGVRCVPGPVWRFSPAPARRSR